MTHYPAEINLAEEEQKSIEIPNSGGARKSKLATTGDTIRFPYEGLKTAWEAVQRGCKISKNGRCFGWRSSQSAYSWISYTNFIKRAENFGSGLVKIGLIPGQSPNVGIYAQNSVEWVVAQYGIWSQSAVVVPLYDTLGPSASTFMIKQAEIEIVICDQEQKVRNLISRTSETPSLQHIILTNVVSKELNELVKEKKYIKLHSFTEVEDLGEKRATPVLCPETSDIALICYTSGTTGDPKGVILTHENLASAASTTHFMLGESGPSKDDSVISYLPQAHIFAQIVQLIFLMVGGSIGFFSGDINKLVDDMRILQPTFFPAVPRLLNKLYDKAQALVRGKLKLDLCTDTTMQNEIRSACKPLIDGLGGRLRLIFSGAAPIYKNVLEFYTKIVGCKVMEVYGQTECSGPCTFVLLDSDYTGNVGSPVPCCVVKLLDVPEMGYYSKNARGEVCIKGPGIFKGYLKDPQKTAETLDADGWLHTGDIGMWLPNGSLKIIDRKKNILKLAQGVYVAPEKIECIYALCPFVAQIFVHGDSLKSFLVAVVVPEKEMVLPWCRENLKNCDAWSDICKDPSVRQLILDDMLRIGKEAGLLQFEQVKDIHLHPEVLTFEGGFLTPTSKLKREVCKKYFGEEIAALTNNIHDESV